MECRDILEVKAVHNIKFFFSKMSVNTGSLRNRLTSVM